jgi:hypothetical protein
MWISSWFQIHHQCLPGIIGLEDLPRAASSAVVFQHAEVAAITFTISKMYFIEMINLFL